MTVNLPFLYVIVNNLISGNINKGRQKARQTYVIYNIYIYIIHTYFIFYFTNIFVEVSHLGRL